jgi:hypothetical protein
MAREHRAAIPQGFIQIRLNCPQEILQWVFRLDQDLLPPIDGSLIGRKLLEVSVEKDVRCCCHSGKPQAVMYDSNEFCLPSNERRSQNWRGYSQCANLDRTSPHRLRVGLSAICGFNLRVGRQASSRKGIPACDPLQQLMSGIHLAPFAYNSGCHAR